MIENKTAQRIRKLQSINRMVNSFFMKKIIVCIVLIFIITLIFNTVNAFGQSKSKSAIWNGEWNFSDNFQPGKLIIKPLSGNKFKFTLSALNGANQGEISGVAKFKGNKAFF